MRIELFNNIPVTYKKQSCFASFEKALVVDSDKLAELAVAADGSAFSAFLDRYCLKDIYVVRLDGCTWFRPFRTESHAMAVKRMNEEWHFDDEGVW